jgi:hypothetical protein
MRSAADVGSGGYSMSIQDLGSIGEFIAALATLATLVYLAIQIRQNTKQVEEGTRAARASAVSAGLQLINSNRLAIYSDQNVASIWARGMEDPHTLEPIEQMRFRLIFSNALDSEFNNFYQTKDSGFSPDAWDAHVSTTRRILSTPGGKWFWQKFSNEYTQDFQEEVARILSSDA